jgi:hypothetical protein
VSFRVDGQGSAGLYILRRQRRSRAPSRWEQALWARFDASERRSNEPPDGRRSREQFENSNAQTPGKADYDDAPEHRTKQLD